MAEPLRVTIETTAHPDIIRVHVNRRLGPPRPADGPARDHAAARPVIAAVLQVPGVREVTVAGGRITVKKDPQADWRSIGPAIQGKIFRTLR